MIKVILFCGYHLKFLHLEYILNNSIHWTWSMFYLAFNLYLYFRVFWYKIHRFILNLECLYYNKVVNNFSKTVLIQFIVIPEYFLSNLYNQFSCPMTCTILVVKISLKELNQHDVKSMAVYSGDVIIKLFSFK